MESKRDVTVRLPTRVQGSENTDVNNPQAARTPASLLNLAPAQWPATLFLARKRQPRHTRQVKKAQNAGSEGLLYRRYERDMLFVIVVKTTNHTADLLTVLEVLNHKEVTTDSNA